MDAMVGRRRIPVVRRRLPAALSAAVLAAVAAAGAGGEATAPHAEGKAVEEFLARVEALPPPRKGRSRRHDLDREGRIVGLRLRGIDLRPGDFPVLGGLARLETLDLRKTKVADGDLVHLARLERLRDLDLGETALTGSTLAALKGLARLERLDLRSTKVTDRSLADLEALRGLRRLDLARTAIGDAGLARLAKLSRLESLKLAETRVTDAGLPHLKALEGLRGVTLDGTAVTEAGIASLAGLPRFAWMASPEGTARELAARLERGDLAGAAAMVTIGLELPERGKFALLKLDPIPPTDRDRERGRRRFRLEMHWTVEAEKLDETFHADLAVSRASVLVLEEGVAEKPGARPPKPTGVGGR